MRLTRIAEKLSEEQIRGLVYLKRRLKKKRALVNERKRLLKRVARLDRKIARLDASTISKATGKRRKLSAAARKRMGQAQRKRWAVAKKTQKARTA